MLSFKFIFSNSRPFSWTYGKRIVASKRKIVISYFPFSGLKMYKDILILLSLSIENSLFCKLDAVRDRIYFLLVLYYKTKPHF